MITADNAPALAPSDAPEGHPATTAPPTPENAAQGQQANVMAQLCLLGYAVHEVTTGGYFVSRWDGTRYCAALADLEAFARQVGAVSCRTD